MNDHVFNNGTKHTPTIKWAQQVLTGTYGLDEGSDFDNVVVAPDYARRATSGPCVHIEAEVTAPDGTVEVFAAQIITTDLGALFRAIGAGDADDSGVLPAPIAVHAVYV